MSLKAPTLKSPPDKLSVLLATGFGVGYIPKIPGTAASLLTLPLAFTMAQHANFGIYLLITLLLTLLAVPVCGRAAGALGEVDPHCIVLDEVAGMLIALCPMSLNAFSQMNDLLELGIAFALFRVFDIWKPGFITESQKLHGGWGIILDDVLAGILSAGILGLLNARAA